MIESGNDGMKTCPYCAEDIKSAAILCRYCGTNLESGETTRRTAQTDNPPPAVQTEERTLWQDNPSHWAYMAIYALGVLLIPLGFLGVIILIWAVLDRKHRVYTITNKRVIQKRGIIGKDMSEIDLKDIRNVIVAYGVIDRLVGIGNVALGTAAQSGMEIKLAGCIDPERVRQIVVDAKG